MTVVETASPTSFQVTEYEEFVQALAGGLTVLYQEIFSEPPYFEVFNDEKVQGIFAKYFNEGLLFLQYLDGDVVGFGALLPFATSALFEAQVTDETGIPTLFSGSYLQKKLGFSPDCTWYLADLGVQRSQRGRGIGSELLTNLLKTLPVNTAVLLRTSQANKTIQDFYRSKFGFNAMDIAMDVSNPRRNGTIQKDRRIIMAKVGS